MARPNANDQLSPQNPCGSCLWSCVDPMNFTARRSPLTRRFDPTPGLP